MLTGLIAVQCGLLAGVPEFLVGGMPGGRTPVTKQPHGDRGSVYDAHSFVGEEGQIGEELSIE